MNCFLCRKHQYHDAYIICQYFSGFTAYPGSRGTFPECSLKKNRYFFFFRGVWVVQSALSKIVLVSYYHRRGARHNGVHIQGYHGDRGRSRRSNECVHQISLSTFTSNERARYRLLLGGGCLSLFVTQLAIVHLEQNATRVSYRVHIRRSCSGCVSRARCGGPGWPSNSSVANMLGGQLGACARWGGGG